VATKSPQPRRRMGAGLGVDVFGGPVIDPTANVIALSQAANKRQDDLREAENQRQDDLRAASSRIYQVEMRSLETIVDIYGRHAKELDEIRAYYAKEIRDLDSKNQAAIRQIDVAALHSLAQTSAQTAESLRSLVQNTAATVATQTANTFQLVIDRVAALEKTSYEGSGRSTGTASTWAAIFGGFLILSAVVGALAFFFGRSGNSSQPVPVVQMQAPPGYALVPVPQTATR